LGSRFSPLSLGLLLWGLWQGRTSWEKCVAEEQAHVMATKSQREEKEELGS
jgi:hypothetical protein